MSKKGTYAASKNKITKAFINECGHLSPIWVQCKPLIRDKCKFLHLFDAYSKEPVIVTNCSKFHHMLHVLTNEENTRNIQSELSEIEKIKFGELTSYTVTYISTLFDRNAGWNNIVYNFAVFAFEN